MKTITKIATVFALALAPFVSAYSAAAFPSRVITIVVPFAPGGPTDQSARLIGKALAARLGQSVIIDNRPGAGGTIGTAAVARATADGYTLLLASTSTFGVAPLVYSAPRYSPTTSFAPLGMVARSPLVFVGKPGMKGDTLKDLISTAKVEKLSYGSAGNGSAQHLALEMFKLAAKVEALHVPYKGSGPMLVDLMSGQIQYSFDTMTAATPHVKSGKVVAIAQTRAKRSAGHPNVPTMIEQGSGRIINIGSISAQMCRPNSAPYNTTKHGLVGLTKSIALEGRDFNVVCSALHPGNVLTERRAASGKTQDAEPMMTVDELALTAVTMAALPLHVNVLEAIVLPTQQAYLGRG